MSIYAVNGKEPIAAWIPSRDTAGNGTTTLTDLVGSNHGTLTNMDPATDWVADTGAGGIRALDFDGVNDQVSMSDVFSPSGDAGWSFWMKMSETPANFKVALWGSTRPTDSWNTGWGFYWTSPTSLRFFRGSWNTHTVNATVATPSSWTHVAISSTTSAISFYLNGSLAASGSNVMVSVGQSLVIGEGNSSTYNVAARFDDIRLFNGNLLDASDVAYLYNSGNGRGRIAAAATMVSMRGGYTSMNGGFCN